MRLAPATKALKRGFPSRSKLIEQVNKHLPVPDAKQPSTLSACFTGALQRVEEFRGVGRVTAEAFMLFV
jgi:hypothetical protein